MGRTQWQLVELPMGGVDAFTDAVHVLPGKLEQATYCRIYEPGKLAKRHGLVNSLSTSVNTLTAPFSLSSGERLKGFRDETLLFNKERMYTYGDTVDLWADKGRVSEAFAERLSVWFEQNHDIPDSDMAINGNIAVVVWPGGDGDPSGVVIDLRNESVIQTWVATPGFGCTWRRAIAVGTSWIYVFQGNATDTAVYYDRIDVTSQTPGDVLLGPVVLVNTTTSLDAGVLPDICPVTGIDAFVIAYAENGPVTVQVDYFLLSSSSVNPYLNYNDAEIVTSCMAVEAVDAESVWISYDTESVVRFQRYDTILLTQQDIGTIMTDTPVNRIGIARITASRRLIFVEYQGESGVSPCLRYRAVIDGGTFEPGAYITHNDWVPSSKGFSYEGRVYVTLAYESEAESLYAQKTYALAELTDVLLCLDVPRWVGTMARGNARPAEQTGFLSAIWQHPTTDATRWEFAASVNYRFFFEGSGDSTVVIPRAGVNRGVWTFDDAIRYQSAQWGNTLIVAGARPGVYDGNTITDLGFSSYPERWGVVSPSSAGGQLNHDLTNYWWTNVRLVYEWEDAQGNIYRSTPSPIISFANGSGGGNTTTGSATIPIDEDLWSTNVVAGWMPTSVGPVRLVPYRTVQVQGTLTAEETPEQVYYRDSLLGYAPELTTDIIVGLLYDDTELQQQEQLYVNGDILDNVGTPAFKLVAYHGDRLWLGGCEESGLVWFSQPFREGEGPRFNEALRLNIGQPVTAIASMDSQLVVFSEDRIYVVSGSGPPATGGLDIGFATTVITTDTGCSNPRSVVEMPLGLMFLGAKGIYLLERSLQVKFIGAPVREYVEDYPDITSSVLTPDRQEVVFSARDSDSVSVRFAYNYTLEQWFTDTFATEEYASADVVWDPDLGQRVYAGLVNDGRVVREEPGTRTNWDGVQIVTPWIKLNTIQGWQRVRKAMILFDSGPQGGGGFTVEVGYDYSDSYSQTATFSVIILAALTTEQVEVHFAKQTCQAFRLRITEIPLDESSTGFLDIKSVVFEAGFYPRSMQLQASKARL